MKISTAMLPLALVVFACGCGATTATTAPEVSAAPPTLYGAPIGNVALVSGAPAPDFSAVAHDGATIRISALRGKEVVLFFYSVDDAPGATREVVAFRESWDRLERDGVAVIGISTDTVGSHKQFASHWRLPFPLLSDPAGTIAHAYGVRDTYGTLDYDTVLIDADGNVKKVYRRIDPTKHVSQLLSDLES